MRGAVAGVAWLLVAAVGQVAAFEVVRRLFVDTERGQWLDAAAFDGHHLVEEYLEGPIDVVLSAVAVLSLAAAAVVIGYVGLVRRQVGLAATAAGLVVGANATAQALQSWLERPELGVELAHVAGGNTLPSGHTTVAASVVAALVLVLPPNLRGRTGLLGAGYAALAGVATLSAAWHRPSDAVAALLLVGAWAAVAGALLALVRRRDGAGQWQPAHRLAVTTLALAGLGLLVVATIAMVWTYQALPTPIEQLGSPRLSIAYAGGAAGIAGATALVIALVMVVVGRVVPRP